MNYVDIIRRAVPTGDVPVFTTLLYLQVMKFLYENVKTWADSEDRIMSNLLSFMDSVSASLRVNFVGHVNVVHMHRNVYVQFCPEVGNTSVIVLDLNKLTVELEQVYADALNSVFGVQV